MKPIHHCQRCVREHGTACCGACPCPIDGADITVHALELYCPIGLFKMGLGDRLARLFHFTGIRRAFLWAIWILSGRPNKEVQCGCKLRQLALNTRWARVKEAARRLWGWLRAGSQ